MTIVFRKQLVMKDIKQRNFEECSNPTLINQINALGTKTYQDGCKLKEFLGLVLKENYSSSVEFLDTLRRLPTPGFQFFLDYFPASKKLTYREEISLIRMMEYFLEKGKYEYFFLTAKKVSSKVLASWFDINFEKVSTTINDNISRYEHSAFFVLLSMDSETLERYYPCITKMPELEESFGITYENLLLKNGISSIEYIDNPYFMKLFAKTRHNTQIYLAELIEGNDFDRVLVDKLHKLLNRPFHITEDNFYKVVFEMTKEKLMNILGRIINSSYFHKSDMKNQEIWKIIFSDSYSSENKIEDYYKTWFSNLKDLPTFWNLITYDDADKLDLSIDYYAQVTDAFEQCREYARKSIVSSLYPLNTLTDKVTYLTGKFNVLVTTVPSFEVDNLLLFFKAYDFRCFSTLYEKNVSHYGDDIMFGYFTGVIPELISHIYHIDSLSNAGAKFVRKLTKRNNWFLDIDDLNYITFCKRTYNQLCVKTKNQGKILKPDCVICIEKVDEKSQEAADKMGLNILVLPKEKGTIEDNEDYYGYLM